MAIKIRYSLTDFTENLDDDFYKYSLKFPSCTKQQYLDEVLKSYQIYGQDKLNSLFFVCLEPPTFFEEYNYFLYDKDGEILFDKLTKILTDKIQHLRKPNTLIKRNIQGDILKDNFENLTFQNAYLEILKDEHLYFKPYYFSTNYLKKYEAFFIFDYDKITFDENKFLDFSFAFPQILDFLKNEISPETLSSEDTEDFEPLSQTQKKTIGLILQSGIVEFLCKKYSANENEIAKFFEILTKEQLKQKTLYNRIKVGHRDYAIKNKIDKSEVDLRLKAIFKKSII